MSSLYISGIFVSGIFVASGMFVDPDPDSNQYDAKLQGSWTRGLDSWSYSIKLWKQEQRSAPVPVE